MTDKRFIDELGERIAEAMRESPAQDLDKNLHALLGAFFDRYDLVLREDFEVQKHADNIPLGQLAARLSELEASRRGGSGS